jgi:hypothetical protein
LIQSNLLLALEILPFTPLPERSDGWCRLCLQV